MTFAELAVMLDDARVARRRPLPDDRRIGDWGMTASGRRFWPRDPQVGDICIEDIAHSLSLQCRFAGHTRAFYSVGQHSVLVARLCSEEDRLVGLLHDATEAYLQDIIRPLKRALPSYRALEQLWALTIGLDLGVGERLVHLPEEVHAADRALLIAERRDLMPPSAAWKTGPSDHPQIEPWSPERARAEFLHAFRAYTERAP